MPHEKKKSALNLPFYNSTNYPLAIKGQLSEAEYTEDESKILRYHQFVVKEFFTRNLQQRGILICHGMGQGKTRLATSIAVYINTFDTGRRILVLSAKSLAANFSKEVMSYTGKSQEYVDAHFKFVSLNASNMYKQIEEVNKREEAAALEKRLGDFMEDVVRESSLENSLLIIDEAHNLFNSITNGARNATALYDLIMSTTNLKLILMSGTPIINDPFELVPCFNMLRGMMRIDVVSGSNEFNKDIIHGKQVKALIMGGDDDAEELNELDELDTADPEIAESKIVEPKKERVTNLNKMKNFGKPDKFNQKPKFTTLFSEDIDEFENFFVDKEKRSIKNAEKFKNRIVGLVSYYGDLYFPSDKNKPGFPKELDTIVEKVHMSQTQFARYIAARMLEQEETKLGYRAKESRFSSSTGGSSTYRVKSRQISNYCIPEYALGPARGKKAREKFIDKITLDDLQNLDEYSPKMAKIIHNINKHANQKGIVYSQFVSGEGIGIFARVLKAMGWKQFADGESDDSDYNINNKPKKQFAILSGNVDPDERARIIQMINVKDSNIDLLLLSGAVAEGIDLKRMRHVHCMEPFWNYARISQVKTRAIRYLSHEDLPENERNVQVYIYLSDYPSNYPKSKIKEPTTDMDLYQRSIDNMQIIDTFIQAIAEASIDCSLHYSKLDSSVQKRIQCKLCSPNNVMLFHPVLNKDMTLPSACRPYAEKKISVEEIQLPGSDEKFYYKKDKVNGMDEIHLYHFNKKLNGYAPLLRTHPMYADLMSKLILEN